MLATLQKQVHRDSSGPVRRAYRTLAQPAKGREARSFEDAFADKNPSRRSSPTRLSKYTERLQRIQSGAGSDRLLVLLNEDLRHKRGETLKRVWEFIGADPDRGTVEMPVRNLSMMAKLKQRRRAKKRQYPPMAPATRKKLLDVYADEVDALEACSVATSRVGAS